MVWFLTFRGVLQALTPIFIVTTKMKKIITQNFLRGNQKQSSLKPTKSTLTEDVFLYSLQKGTFNVHV